MADLRSVTATFSVAPQISPGDVAAVAAAGFRTIINNRPDGEAPGQPLGAEIAAAAAAAGLAYHTVPIVGGPNPDQVAQMGALIAEAQAPVLAFCRSGTRSITVWALAQARLGAMAPEALVEAGARSGYDLSPLAPALARLSGG
jgi:uncharacterized protein (TIGR01244 family)